MSRQGIPLPLLLLLALADQAQPYDHLNLPTELPADFKAHQTGCRECRQPEGLCDRGRTMLGKTLMGPDFEIDRMPRMVARGEEHPDCCMVFRVKFEGRQLVIVKGHGGQQLFEAVEQIEAQRLLRSIEENSLAAFAQFEEKYKR